MKTKPTRRDVLISAATFVFNVIVLLLIALLMLAVNQSWQIAEFFKNNTSRVIFVVATIVVLVLLSYLYMFFESTHLFVRPVRQVEIFALLDISLLMAMSFGKYIDPNARAFAFFALICATLIGRREAMFFNFINALLIFLMDINLSEPTSGALWEYSAGLLITFCSGTLVVFISRKIKTRLQCVLIVFVLLVPIEIIIGVMEILFAEKTDDTYLMFAYGAIGAILSTLLYMIILPVFELLFSELTAFRLRELTASNAPLLKKLKEEAPGTYNHSMVVAQLAEACAIEIGEDGELARAAAYYHDVGKLKNPDMFTENQADYNVHNELTPELSADIIRSHTKDGARLIKKHHLPEYFADVAIQHHGTLPIKYFYAKALRMSDGELNIASYSYPGPVPQTRIAAIIMIVDAAEAASRSLRDRSEASIEKLVGSLVEERINLEQFAKCNITMRDLTIITHTIAQSLSGVYHSRISYPKIMIGKKQ